MSVRSWFQKRSLLIPEEKPLRYWPGNGHVYKVEGVRVMRVKRVLTFLGMGLVAAGLVYWDAYGFLLRTRESALLFLIALPIAAWIAFRKGSHTPENERLWAGFAAAALLVIGGLAIDEAAMKRHHNCWTFEDGTVVDVVECVPGSTPFYDVCNQVNTSSSGGTVWNCRKPKGEIFSPWDRGT